MTDQLIPLATLSIELDTTPDRLAARLGDDVLLNSVGFRCVERERAAALIDAHRAQQAEASRRDAERRSARDARLRAAGSKPLALRERLRARRDALAAVGIEPALGNALADLQALDKDNALVKAGQRAAAMLDDVPIRHRGDPR